MHRTKPAAGRASAASTPMTSSRRSPRSDSLASLLMPAANEATPLSSSSSSVVVSRSSSRKKRMHRSSLEFLEDGNDGGAGAGDRATAAEASPFFSGSTTVGNKSVERKRKRMASSSSSLELVTPPLPPPPNHHRRQISRRSKSKLRCLSNKVQERIQPAMDSRERRPQQKNQRQGKGDIASGSDGARIRKRTESKRNNSNAPSEKESAKNPTKRDLDNDRTCSTTDQIDKNKVLPMSKSSSLNQLNPRKTKKRAILFPQSKGKPSFASHHLTPKTNTTCEIKEALPMSNNSFLNQLNPKKRSTKKRAVLFPQSKENPLLASHHRTPETNENKANVHGKARVANSDSPLDYRPVSRANDGAISLKDAATDPMMKLYVEQWTNPSPESTGSDAKYNNRNDPAHANVGYRRGVADSPKKADDPSSSSVISTSSDSDGDEEAGRYGDCLAIDKKSEQLVARENSSENSAGLNAKENLELEYGRLLFMKQDLERKMRAQEMDAKRTDPWTCDPPTVRMGPAITADFFTPGKREGNNDIIGPFDGKTSGGEALSLREEVTFGEMAYRHIMAEQRKAKLKGGNSCEEDQERSRAAKNHGKNHQHGRRVGPACRDDTPPFLESGKIQKNYGEEYNSPRRNGYFEQGKNALSVMHPSSKPEPKKGGTIRSNCRDDTPQYLEADQRGEEEYVEEYNTPEHHEYFKRGNNPSTRHPTAKPKPKKKRKRRVVETITRVIHEESEEEGSASTRGEERHGNNHSRPGAKEDGFVPSRKYRRDDDEETIFGVKQSRPGRSNFGKLAPSPGKETQRVPHGRGQKYGFHQRPFDYFRSERNG